MHNILAKQKEFWKNPEHFFSTAVSAISFIVSMFINFWAVTVSFRDAGNSTTDILLSNLPVVNTDIIFSEGILVFAAFIIFLFVLYPKIIPFTLKSMALFITIRACFVVMTHLGQPAGHITTDLGNFGYVSLGSDLFFSGHTGMPFLMSLLFWDNKYLRYVFLFCSVLAGCAVILGHLHYTIDVFSAFFITHGIYLIAKKFFVKDYKLFRQVEITSSNVISV